MGCCWVCLIADDWACANGAGCEPNCTCPEEETCAKPTTFGASGDKITTPCAAAGTGSGVGGGD